MPDTTLVLTSCNRPDTLARTLESIASCDLSAIKKIIVIEDSDSPHVAEIVAARLKNIPHLFLQNSRTIGQIASIDRAYSYVDTPYIFHCEDDWLFPSSLFIDESRKILEARREVFAVMMRDWDEASGCQKRSVPSEIVGIKCRLADTKDHRKWGSLSFNPGLRRTVDYVNHAPYSKIGPERDLSHYYKMKGFRLVFLEAGDVQHIGVVPTIKFDENRRWKKPGFLYRSIAARLSFYRYKRSHQFTD